jgi:hypothetical protein
LKSPPKDARVNVRECPQRPEVIGAGIWHFCQERAEPFGEANLPMTRNEVAEFATNSARGSGGEPQLGSPPTIKNVGNCTETGKPDPSARQG